MDSSKLILIAGVCIFTAAVCRLFDKTSGEYSVMIKTAAAAAILTAVTAWLIPVVDRVEQLYESSGGEPYYLEILYKCLGICFLTQLAADICRDSGEGTLAVQAETAGKTALLAVSLPLFEQAAELARGFMI